MYYGQVRFEAAAYQDDILKPSQNLDSAQVGMTKLAIMLEERGLQAHEDKEVQRGGRKRNETEAAEVWKLRGKEEEV